jgi:hypothetical protein
MKKLFIALGIVAVATITIVACKKNEQVVDVNKAFTVESVKAWFNNEFKQTAAFRQNNTGNDFKIPNWKTGIVYSMGKVQIAEFVLQTNKKKITLLGEGKEAEQKRVAEATKHRILFIKAPNKPIEVRIMQLVPEYKYLQKNLTAYNQLNFSNYKKGFVGTFMLYDYNGNFEKGYLHAYNGVRALKKGTPPTNDATTQHITNPWMLDGLDPDCHYIVNYDYFISCSGGWNADEGFNPDYCSMSITIVSVEFLYCDDDTDPLAICINNGATSEYCLCTLYNIGCVEEEEEEDESAACNKAAADCFGNPKSVAIKQNGSYEENTDVSKTVILPWVFFEGNSISTLTNWKLVSREKAVITRPTVANTWVFNSIEHKDDYMVGTIVCGDAQYDITNKEYNHFLNFATAKLTYKVKTTYTCKDYPVTTYYNDTSPNSWTANEAASY